jgi:hypothetical protein
MDQRSLSTVIEHVRALLMRSAHAVPKALPSTSYGQKDCIKCVITADCLCLQRLEGTKSTGAASQAPLLEITVSDPVKQGDGVQAYVSYRVSTKVSDACNLQMRLVLQKGPSLCFSV